MPLPRLYMQYGLNLPVHVTVGKKLYYNKISISKQQNHHTYREGLPSGVGSTRYLMLLILISNADCSTRPTGVDPAILLPSTLKNERLGGGGGKERGKEGREGGRENEE